VDQVSVPHAEVEAGLRGLRRLSTAAGLVMLVQALLLIGTLSSAERVLLPITVDFPGDAGERVVLGQVDIGVGVVVL